MKKPTPAQIASAWNDMPGQYGVRVNKTNGDGRPFEVFFLLPGPISDETLKVMASFSDHGAAVRMADDLEDTARAREVLKLFID